MSLSGARPGRASRWAVEVVVFALFVVVSFVATYPLALHFRTHTIDLGIDDPLLNMRFARCVHDWMLGRAGDRGLFDFDFFFPHPLAATTTDPALGVALMTLPMRAFTQDYVWMINAASWLTFPLSAHALYLLTKELTRSRAAGIVAGLAFAFCFFRIRHLDHPNLMQMQWLPYALAFLHRLQRAPSARNAACFSVLLLASLAASCNLGLYSALVFPVASIWAIATARPEHRVALAGWMALACLVVALPLYAIYRNYLVAQDLWLQPRDAVLVKKFAGHVESFLAAPPFSALYAKNASRVTWESPMFPGAVVLVLASVGVFGAATAREARGSSLRRALLVPFGTLRAAAFGAGCLSLAYLSLATSWMVYVLVLGVVGFGMMRWLTGMSRRERGPSRARGVALYAAMGVVFTLLSFGLEITEEGRVLREGFWSLITRLPGFSVVRTPGRFFFVVSICLAVLAGHGVSRLSALLRTERSKCVLVAVLSILVLLELRVAPIPLRRITTLDLAPTVHAALASAAPGAVVELPVVWGPAASHSLLWGNLHRHPSVNGMAGFSLPYFGRMEDPQLRGAPGRETLESLHAAGLRWVVMHRGELNDEQITRYAELLSAVGAVTRNTFGKDDLIELPPGPPPRPFVRKNVTAWIEIAARRSSHVSGTHTVSIDVDFRSPTSEFVYQPGLTALKLDMKIGDVTASRPLYLAPALVHPKAGQLVRRELPLELPAGRYPVEVTVSSPEGIWATRTVTITLQ